MNTARDHRNRIIHRFIEFYALCMHVHTNAVVISQSNSIAKGFWFLMMTGQALLMSPKERNASRDGLVKLWENAFIICNTITP